MHCILKKGREKFVVDFELVDLTRFISLWQEFYNKMNDEDKALMPLVPIYFLAPQE